MIRNEGVADSAAFTILGVSTSRYHPRHGLIGQFGSGSKHAIALFLRFGINPVISTGNLLMEFFTRPKFIGGQQFDQVCVKYSGKDIEGNSKTATEDLGWTLQWGTQDWTQLAMAFREVVSNAIDGSILLMGKSYKDVEFKVKDKPRAKAGHTAVYLRLELCSSTILTLPTLIGRFFQRSVMMDTFLSIRREFWPVPSKAIASSITIWATN
jgi:hypothetical protein